ncbi:Helitron helicase [Phytophthora megakarya]|uniref:Helitron helicase n=1 Tax=Phytophthora megakarya TaxID=4795 RepID=A0A225VMZ4_9STRA|nr:Helitron helicase [Phytophthora megakarya]
MKLPGDMVIPNPVEDPDEDEEIVPGAIPKGMTRLIDHMNEDVNNPEIGTDEYFANRTILTTTNAMVPKINAAVADYGRVLRQPDHLDNNQRNGPQNQCSCSGSLTGRSLLIPVHGLYFFELEVLHAVNLNGIPPHVLMLKLGIPIMMMRN